MAYFHCLIGGGSSGGGYELTVTCDAEFAGTTITCTDGVTTLTKTCPSSSPYEVVFEIPNGGDWTISGTISGDVYSTSINIPSSLELHYISTPEGSTVLPTDDIQTWLACAGITDKSYTTLSEVLADIDTLETLLRDSNSCDYMARSTTWAGSSAGIVDSSDVMALVGRYDYCCNALLADSTWNSAITSSTYWDKVQQPLVPYMKSATTPFCSVYTDNSYSAWSGSQLWWIFNGDENSGDSSASGLTTTDSWVGVEFPRAVIVSKFYLMNETATPVYSGTFSIDASNDGNTWTTLGTFTNSGQAQTGSKTYYDINNSTAYTHYRFHNLTIGTGAVENHGWSAQEMQFYGRKSGVDNEHGIIQTAPNDTVYYIDNGQQVTIGTAGSDGIVDVDFSDFEEGTYTFGSTTAKNPTNLSNNYTKQVKITKNPYGGTTEFYLMPDNKKMFYWYGYAGEKFNVDNTGGQTLTYNTNDIYMSINSSKLANHLFLYSDSISNVSDNYDYLRGILSATNGKDGFQINLQSPYNGASNANVYGIANNGEGLNVPKYYNYEIASGISSANVRVGATFDVVEGKVFAVWIE